MTREMKNITSMCSSMYPILLFKSYSNSPPILYETIADNNTTIFLFGCGRHTVFSRNLAYGWCVFSGQREISSTVMLFDIAMKMWCIHLLPLFFSELHEIPITSSFQERICLSKMTTIINLFLDGDFPTQWIIANDYVQGPLTLFFPHMHMIICPLWCSVN